MQQHYYFNLLSKNNGNLGGDKEDRISQLESACDNIESLPNSKLFHSNGCLRNLSEQFGNSKFLGVEQNQPGLENNLDSERAQLQIKFTNVVNVFTTICFKDDNNKNDNCFNNFEKHLARRDANKWARVGVKKKTIKKKDQIFFF